MFTVYSCCQPFRLLQSVPPNIISFRYEMDSMKKQPKTVRRLIATPSICPCSVLDCSRPNSDQYSLGISSGPPLRQIMNNRRFLRKKFGPSHYDREYDKSDRRSDQTSPPHGRPISYAIKIPMLVHSEKLQLM